MPGNSQLSVDLLVEECRRLYGLGIQAVLLFGIPEHKDEHGLVACETQRNCTTSRSCPSKLHCPTYILLPTSVTANTRRTDIAAPSLTAMFTTT